MFVTILSLLLSDLMVHDLPSMELQSVSSLIMTHKACTSHRVKGRKKTLRTWIVHHTTPAWLSVNYKMFGEVAELFCKVIS